MELVDHYETFDGKTFWLPKLSQIINTYKPNPFDDVPSKSTDASAKQYHVTPFKVSLDIKIEINGMSLK